MVFLNGVHFGHIQTEMLLIHISRTFLESLGIGKWSFFDEHDVIQFLVILSSVSFIVIACICANLLYQDQGSTHQEPKNVEIPGPREFRKLGPHRTHTHENQKIAPTQIERT